MKRFIKRWELQKQNNGGVAILSSFLYDTAFELALLRIPPIKQHKRQKEEDG